MNKHFNFEKDGQWSRVYKDFSLLKPGDIIYKLTLNNTIEYDGEFNQFVTPTLERKIEEFKIKDLLYPGIIQGASYHYMTNHGIGTSETLKYDNQYVTVILDNNEEHTFLNKCYSISYNRIISFDGENIYFTHKEALRDYISWYCEYYIREYMKEIDKLQDKINHYNKFRYNN